MYYHVRITQKSNTIRDEIELDLNEERLCSQYIIPYENNESIFIDGKTIHPDDIERIKISRTESNSSILIPISNARRKEKRNPQILSLSFQSDGGTSLKKVKM